MNMIRNPILKGFNPDPSIVRVGEDYYIATSTFEWFPGIQIHHSKDLVHWRLVHQILREKRLLDMTGNPDSGGVWAPCLSYHEGTYYLIYTDAKSLTGAFKDTPNYLTTAPAIEGPWSDPVYLNSSGFDPSLFHDEDGRKWLLNMVWDHRKGRNPFYGIQLQEYDAVNKKLIGDKHIIFRGTELGCTEGPHLYKKDGWYYLMTAEGGTGYEHAVTMARSRSITGPYEVDPQNPILTAYDAEDAVLKKAGHASLVETESGEWYIAHLCARPLLSSMKAPLGRETALQRCYWKDGWLRVEHGPVPSVEVAEPAIDKSLPAVVDEPVRDEFDGQELGLHYATLREPADPSWLSLTERPGYLRLYGRESLNSRHHQSLVARRIQHFELEAGTCVQFEPEHFQQMAGLICYYNTKNYYYLRLSRDEEHGLGLNVLINDQGVYDELLDSDMWIEEGTCYHLRVKIHAGSVQFFASTDGEQWFEVGGKLPLDLLSDEHATRMAGGYFTDWGFTGAFVGVCVQDLSGERKYADFDYFEYQGR